MERLRNIILFGLVSLFLVAQTAQAAPTSLTYQGRILKTDGRPLESANVSFLFEITNSAGTCVLYREQVNGINMVNSGGVFDVKIGASHSYPASPTFTIIDSFNNSGALVCDGGVVFNPVATDGRLLRVQFYDGSSWRVIAPDSIIRSVPFAGYSDSAAKLGTHYAQDFILKNTVNGNTDCGSGSFLTWNAATQTFGCAVAPTGGGGSGTVTDVISANSYLSVANSTTTPTLTLNVGTGPNTVAAGNDSRLTNSRTPTGTAGGDLSGTYPNPGVAKIQGVGVDFAVAPTLGQVLTFDGTNWVADSLPATNAGTVTSITAGTGLTGGAITSNGTIGLGAPLLGLHNIATTGYIQRTGAGTYVTTSASALASTNNLVSRDGSGVSSFYGLELSGATSGSVLFQAPNIVTNYSLTWPDSQGANNQVMVNNGSGVLSWANVPAAPGSDCGAGNVLTYNSGAFTCVPDQVGSAGGGIATLNSQTGSAQSFALATAGTAPAWSSASDVHTLNLPFARTAGVTAGLISKAEYDTFNNKQAALGFTPLNVANNLSELTGTAATARGNLGLGTAATYDVAAGATAAAGEVVLGSDTRLTNSRAPSGTAGGDLGGTYPNPDVNRLKGVSLSITALTTGNFLKYNGSNWINSTIATSDVTGLDTAMSGKIDQSQISGTCTAASTLTFSSVTGTWTCSDIAISGTQVSYASQTAKTFFAAPTGGAGAPSFRTIASTDLPSSITDGLWTAVSGNAYRSSGKVGIGTSAPAVRLEIQSDVSGQPVVTGTTQTNGGLRLSSSASNMALDMGNDGGASGSWIQAVNKTDLSILTGRLLLNPSGGNVGIGNTNPLYKLHISGTTYTGSSLLLERFENVGSGAGLDFRSARGTDGTAGAQTLANQEIGQLNFYGTNENGAMAASASSSIRAVAEENTTTTSMSGGLGFRTRGLNGSSLSEKVRISGSGNVGIGTTAPLEMLHIKNTSTSPKIWLESGSTLMPRVYLSEGGDSGAYLEYDATTDRGFLSHRVLGADNARPNLTWTRSNLLGINTATPDSPLHVTKASGLVQAKVQSADNSATLMLDKASGFYSYVRASTQGLARWDFGSTNDAESGTEAGSNFYIRAFDDAGSSSFIPFTILRNSGNVGIGTETPTSPLHVSKTFTPAAAVGTVGIRATLVVNPTADNTTGHYGGLVSADSVGAGATDINTMVGLHAKNVHSGTGLLTYSYGLYGMSDLNSAGTITSQRGAYNIARNNNSGGTVTSQIASYNVAGNSAGGTVGTAYGTYSVAQNTSTGTMTTAYGLYTDVNNTGGGTLTNGYGVYIAANNGVASSWGLYQVGTGDTNYFAGNVGIGTTTPTHILHINGQGRATNSAWATTSDIRLKNVVGEYQYGLDEVLKLHTIWFHYKKDNPLKLPSDKNHSGIIAQELQKVIPEAVEKTPDGYLTVNADPIHWAVVNAIKDLWKKWVEHDEKVETLQRDLASVQEKLEDQKKLNQELLQRLQVLEQQNGQK